MAFETAVTDRLSPSVSVSFETRSALAMTRSVSSVPEAESLTACGASLTQVMLTVAWPVSEPPWPSEMS